MNSKRRRGWISNCPWIVTAIFLMLPVWLLLIRPGNHSDQINQAGASLLSTERSAAIATDVTVDFNRDIRPILSNNCFACHGPDAPARKAALRLDTVEGSRAPLKSGGVAISPGRPEFSRLLHRVHESDLRKVMPPPESGKKLTPRERDLLEVWIRSGAEYAPHWAFRPIDRHDLPPTANKGWLENPVDAFVLARLESEGWSPSPETDRRVLIRRASLDLTGLPPTPEEVDAFVADSAPHAYERLIERLLSSPRYGERMALEWLDGARYADTNGYHIDNERFMWRWRDWVIDAFNANMPFDQFTIEQIAGDLLPDATDSQRIASGFNRNHNINFEGGAIPEEYRTAYVIDRVNTTSTVWLGLTMGCAQCHDHKYDPITTTDYYRFYAFFNNISEVGLDGNTGNAAPSMMAPLPGQKEELSRLESVAAGIRASMDAADPEIDAAMALWEADAQERYTDLWDPLDVLSAVSDASDTILTPQPDGSILASGRPPATETFTLKVAPTEEPIAAIRLEALADASLPVSGPGRFTNGNFVLTEIEVSVGRVGDVPSQTIPLTAAFSDFDQPDFPVEGAIDGRPETGWAVLGPNMGQDRLAVFVPNSPITIPEGADLSVRLEFKSQFAQHSIGKVRLSATYAQDVAISLQPSILSPWSVSQSFTAAREKIFEEAFEPESAPVDSVGGWTIKPEYADATLNNLSAETELAAVYLKRTITTPAARRLTLLMGSDDGLRVWLNGSLVHSNPVARALAADQDRLILNLIAGENRLLVKVVNYGGGFGFTFRRAIDGGFDVPLDVQRLLAIPAGERSESQSASLRTYYRRNHDPRWAELSKLAEAADQETEKFRATIPNTMVMAELEEQRKTNRLIRGQYDQPAEEVSPGIPTVLGTLADSRPVNRLTLARWLVSPDNPLTARVIVNRYWQMLFGTGLVKTAEDFGVQGQWPSHPELLDWLASEFVANGWDVKHLLRLMVTSATYKQQAIVRPEYLAQDPENRLLAYAPRIRLSAEGVRDNALAISGLLVESVGGPSVRTYQPAGLWEELAIDPTGASFSAQVYKQDSGESLYRRSLYLFRKRTVSHPAMSVFDAPSHEFCVVRRSRTNTPLQALVLMNDPTYVEAARVFAEQLLRHDGADEARISMAFEMALARPATAEESSILMKMLAAQRTRFAADPTSAEGLLGVGEHPRRESLDAAELAAWTTVASTILNLDQTITRE